MEKKKWFLKSKPKKKKRKTLKHTQSDIKKWYKKEERRYREEKLMSWKYIISYIVDI